MLTTKGILIYRFDKIGKSISLSYFYSTDLDKENSEEFINELLDKVLSKRALPLPNHDSFRYNKWISYVKDDKESFAKYGALLLSFAIEEFRLDLIKEIYEKCMKYFNEDPNNAKFLSIISINLSLLDKYFPGYVSRYSSETNMIINSPSYNTKNPTDELHLSPYCPNLKP